MQLFIKQLISLAGDGCIILWKVNIQSRKMEIIQRFALPAAGGRAKSIGSCGGNFQDILFQKQLRTHTHTHNHTGHGSRNPLRNV